MTKHFKRIDFFLFFLLAITTLIMLPQLKIPWMLIDDGESLRIAQQMDQSFQQGNYGWFLGFEKESGRFRPAYWLYHYFTYKFFGFNSLYHHLAHLFIYVLISYLLYRMVFLVFKDRLSGFLTGLFFILLGPARENLYRLGTAEPNLCLILITIFYCLFSHQLFSLALLTFIAYFLKETSVSLLPFSLVLYGLSFVKFIDLEPRPQWRRFLLQFVFVNLLAFLIQRLIIYKLGIGGWYSENYQININQALHGLWYYVKLLIEEYKILLIFPLVAIVKNRSFLMLALLIWFGIALFLQSFWMFGMGRYLPPIIIGLIPIIAVSLGSLCKEKRRRFFFLILSIGYFLISGNQILQMYQVVIPGENANQQMVNYLAEEVPKNGSVLFNFSEGGMEYLYEIPLHLKFFYNRTDITVNYFRLEEATGHKNNYYLVSWRSVISRYPWEKIQLQFGNNLKVEKVIGEWRIAKITE